MACRKALAERDRHLGDVRKPAIDLPRHVGIGRRVDLPLLHGRPRGPNPQHLLRVLLVADHQLHVGKDLLHALAGQTPRVDPRAHRHSFLRKFKSQETAIPRFAARRTSSSVA